MQVPLQFSFGIGIATGQHGQNWVFHVVPEHKEDEQVGEEEHGLEQVKVDRLKADEGADPSDGRRADFERRAVLTRAVHEPLVSCFVKASFVIAELFASTDPNSLRRAQQADSLDIASLWTHGQIRHESSRNNLPSSSPGFKKNAMLWRLPSTSSPRTNFLTPNCGLPSSPTGLTRTLDRIVRKLTWQINN